VRNRRSGHYDNPRQHSGASFILRYSPLMEGKGKNKRGLERVIITHSFPPSISSLSFLHSLGGRKERERGRESKRERFRD